MATIRVTRLIPAPIEDVFDWLADSGNYVVSPAVLRNRAVTPAPSGPAYGLGAKREVTTAFGWFQEDITAFERPKVLEYRVRKSLPPINNELGRLEFTEEAGGTRVVWTAISTLRVPVVGELLSRLVAVPAASLGFGDVLRQCERALTARP